MKLLSALMKANTILSQSQSDPQILVTNNLLLPCQSLYTSSVVPNKKQKLTQNL
jgi:hypothetical protein